MAEPILQELFERIRELSETPRNRAAAAPWAPQPETARDHWRGVPRVIRAEEPVPYTIEPEVPLWARILGFDVPEFYTNPRTYLEYSLRMAIYRHECFPDCTVVGKQVPIWLGVPFEPSFFGQATIYSSNASPWIGKRPVVRAPEDLKSLRPPDFFRDGLMPTAHRFYQEIGELLPGDFSVLFPEWGRSPYAVALHLRGMDNIVADMLDRPEFARELIGFVGECRKSWTRQRAQLLGQEIAPANLYNDECNCPLLSPRLYEHFVLPGEQELSRFSGGLAYWHSCGDTTQLIPYIARIPNLVMFHVGPWTRLEKALEVLPDSVALEVCLDPVADVQMASPRQMREKLGGIRALCAGRAYTVRADGIQLLHSLPAELEQMRAWLETAQEVLGQEAPRPPVALPRRQ
jgi:hypothetical protein